SRRRRALRGDDGRPAFAPSRSRGLRAIPCGTQRAATPEPADRHAGVDRRHAERAVTRPVYRFDEIEWHLPADAGADLEAVHAAAALGVARKYYAQGEAGF